MWRALKPILIAATAASVFAAAGQAGGGCVEWSAAGPIIAQAVVPVLPGDDEDALAARILAAEHRLYPHALRLIAAGDAWIEGETMHYASRDIPRILFPDP